MCSVKVFDKLVLNRFALSKSSVASIPVGHNNGVMASRYFVSFLIVCYGDLPDGFSELRYDSHWFGL